MIMLMRIKSQKLEFQTASQSEIDLKIAKRSKYGNFNFVVEQPIWVSIKRTLTGKLAVDGQDFIYCVQIQENVQKQSESERFQNSAISEVFGLFLETEHNKLNSDHLLTTYLSKFSSYTPISVIL